MKLNTACGCKISVQDADSTAINYKRLTTRMNQTHNPQSYSFVQAGSARVNHTFKPTTATMADSRLSPSPFKIQKRDPLHQITQEQGKSPVRRHFSTISPLKQVSTNQYRVYSSRVEAIPSAGSTICGQATTNGGPTHVLSQQPPPIQPQERTIKKPENNAVGLPVVDQARQISAPVEGALPARTSKVIEDRKNAIDQIISNCTQLNFGHSSRHHSDNSENMRLNDKVQAGSKLQSMVRVAASPKKSDEDKQNANDLKRVRTNDGRVTPRGGTIDPALNREIELRKFTSRVATLKEDLLRQVGTVDRERQQLMARSQEQRDYISKNYQQLYAILKEFEMKDVNKVLYWQEECLRTLKSYQQEFSEACARLQLMNQDISPNIAMIKTQIDEQQYKTFMADYRRQIEEITGKVANFQQMLTAARPEFVQKDPTKLAYDIVSLIDYPQGFNKSALCFSFEGKALPKKPQAGGIKILVEDYSQTQPSASEPARAMDEQQPPFRALFVAGQDKQPETRASPTFKKL